MLSRKQRATILVYCLKKLYPLCLKRKNLFTDKSADDLVEELGVYIWVALIRYRRKPYSEALKLAMSTGVNRLTSIVRTRLTVVKRGSNAKMLPESVDDVYWLFNRGIYGSGVQIVDALEAICSAAIMRVGLRRADALVKALVYDWRKKKLTPEQVVLMKTLKRSRSGVRKLVSSFADDIKSQTTVEDHNTLQKIDGMWKAP